MYPVLLWCKTLILEAFGEAIEVFRFEQLANSSVSWYKYYQNTYLVTGINNFFSCVDALILFWHFCTLCKVVPHSTKNVSWAAWQIYFKHYTRALIKGIYFLTPSQFSKQLIAIKFYWDIQDIHLAFELRKLDHFLLF